MCCLAPFLAPLASAELKLWGWGVGGMGKKKKAILIFCPCQEKLVCVNYLCAAFGRSLCKELGQQGSFWGKSCSGGQSA